MKLLLTLIIFVCTLNLSAQSLDSLVKKDFYITKDNFSDVQLIIPKIARFNYAYLRFHDHKYEMRFLLNYTGDNWIFTKQVIFLIDGKTYSVNVSDPQRSVYNGRVEEIIDDPISNGIVNLIANTNSKVYYRLAGTNSLRDYELKPREIKTFKSAWQFWTLNMELLQKENSPK